MNGDEIQKKDYSKVNRCQSISAILWPSFILAGIANTIFFTLFDPAEIALGKGMEPMSLTAAYSIGFFCFWTLTALSGAATRYFLQPCVNGKK